MLSATPEQRAEVALLGADRFKARVSLADMFEAGAVAQCGTLCPPAVHGGTPKRDGKGRSRRGK
jgi:hypothetical protein